ncbi:MAG: malto-oligosyltrehalose trehalohydrolase [Candidatus Bathyarchaeia archaeon]|jgi:maltooligosyltrehalose trehalohydrolase
MRVGATFHKDHCEFTVWAPNAANVKLTLESNKQQIDLAKAGKGYWTTKLNQVKPDTEYMFRQDDKPPKPDPAAHFQPKGVFGPSQVIDHEKYVWKDTFWHGLEFKELVFYEVHVGTFTPQGTFLAMKDKINELADFGINAVELMPVTQFSGSRGWGYDGVFPFALQNSYGTPDDLKTLVDECHKQSVAVFLDFVYNHIGPEGNILNDYAPYFTSDNMTTWGPTINLNGPNSNGVRNYFLENTLHWFRDYHIDGIRLDSILWITDRSPKHFLGEINQAVHQYAQEVGRRLYMIAETGYNEPAVLTPTKEGGYGFDAQWLDDFQHALFSQLTGENKSYYIDFTSIEHLADALTDAYVYVKKPPEFRRRQPEETFRQITAYKFVVFSQNHDQIGNRLLGDRLANISGYEAAKVAAGVVLLSPYVPLLFMGEEYGETSPFCFFTDYQGKELADAIREGRRKEFTEFQWTGNIPDPQSLECFTKSKIKWENRSQGLNGKIAGYYKKLIELRRKVPVLQQCIERNLKTVTSQGKALLIEKQKNNSKALIIANLSNETQTLQVRLDENIRKVLDSTDPIFGGSGLKLPEQPSASMIAPGYCFAVYLNQEALTDQ